MDLAILDFTTVIDMPDAPAEKRAMARVNRGVTFGQVGDLVLAISDYDAVIAMLDAPDEQREIARVNRDLLLNP